MSDLTKIPGVGKNMEKHLFDIGINSIEDLKNKNPEELYKLSCIKNGGYIDRCVLYVSGYLLLPGRLFGRPPHL